MNLNPKRIALYSLIPATILICHVTNVAAVRAKQVHEAQLAAACYAPPVTPEDVARVLAARENRHQAEMLASIASKPKSLRTKLDIPKSDWPAIRKQLSLIVENQEHFLNQANESFVSDSQNKRQRILQKRLSRMQNKLREKLNPQQQARLASLGYAL